MAFIIELETFASGLGQLTVFNNLLPSDIKRVFYIYEAGGATRGGHRHHRAWNALICLAGSCRVYVHDGQHEQEYTLGTPNSCLVLEPTDWHVMDQFSANAILLVLSNEPYSQADYIDTPYATGQYAAESANGLAL